MTFLDDLKGSGQGAIAVFHVFLLNYRKAENSIHAFFEGNDDSSYYLNFINDRNKSKRKILPYKCGNKKGVYAAYEKIKSHGVSNVILLFFVDKDFSDILEEQYPQDECIYVTECYSIENYLVTTYTLQRIWIDIFHLPAHQDKYEIVEKKFLLELSHFYEFMKPLMARIIFAKLCNEKANLNNINLSKMFRFDSDLNLETLESDLSEVLEKMSGISIPKHREEELFVVLEKLEKFGPKIYIRGKYELWFLVKFIEKLTPIIRNQLRDEGFYMKIVTNLNNENAIEILGPRSEISIQLQQFLDNYL